MVLLSFDKDTERISFRHYGISAAPSGVTKSVKSLVNRRQLPNMGALGDVSELLTKSGYGSVRPSPQKQSKMLCAILQYPSMAPTALVWGGPES